MRPSLLVVDDKQDMLKLLERIIKAELDAEVFTVDNGRDALAMAGAGNIGVVLADRKSVV